jgi:hypothetical protein
MQEPGFLDVASWQKADPTLMLGKLRQEIPRLPVELWIINSEIGPVDLYVYLQARFGPPNGFQMKLKSPTSDNLVHWHWSLQYLDRIIEFSGYTMFAQIAVEGSLEPTNEDLVRLVGNIKADFRNYGDEMSRIRKGLERWNVFINPYCRMRRVVTRFCERLEELNVGGVILPVTPQSPEGLESFGYRVKACADIYSEALGICTSLRMLAPVVAESFINLVIFLLVHPSSRADQRLYDTIFRQDVDVRVRALHLNCIGFNRPVDASDQRFKDFQSLMQQRNDFLHGNINPAKLAYRDVFFDGTIPLPKRYENMAELALVNSLKHVEPETALHDLVVVEGLIDLVLESLKDHAKSAVEMFMDTLDPGWNDEKKRSGVLFPGHHTTVVFSGEESATTASEQPNGIREE